MKNYPLLLLLLYPYFSIAQQRDTVIISPVVGVVIDSAEKNQHRIFPYYSNQKFISAVFVKTSDSTIILRATFKGDSVAEKPVSNKEFAWLKNTIEGNYFSNINKGYRKPIFGKAKVNISTGFGLTEFLNIGLRYQFKNAQLGLSVGSIPWIWTNESIISISSNFYLHFGQFSELSGKRAWYSMIGLNYINDNSASWFDLNCRIGRELNISKKIGIELDAGAFMILYTDANNWFLGPGSVSPVGSIAVFYRL